MEYNMTTWIDYFLFGMGMVCLGMFIAILIWDHTSWVDPELPSFDDEQLNRLGR